MTDEETHVIRVDVPGLLNSLRISKAGGGQPFWRAPVEEILRNDFDNILLRLAKQNIVSAREWSKPLTGEGEKLEHVTCDVTVPKSVSADDLKGHILTTYRQGNYMIHLARMNYYGSALKMLEEATFAEVTPDLAVPS